MSNVEIEIEGPDGNLLTIEGRTEIPLDPSARPTVIIDEIVSTDDDGQVIPVTFQDLVHAFEQAPAAIAAKEDILIARFLDAQD